ncbi:MAG: membrane protein insertion efficiency factor YidD [Saprospiraceae bacterium]|nr:membrane protein insertion efficiency factor YidD [Saprospiraceae bacterium]
MRWIILKLINFYWLAFPETKRRQCLFRETCSKHVHRLVKEKGLAIGILAFIKRVKKCRNGYSLYLGNNGFEMKLVDGTIINEDEISSKLLDEIDSLFRDHLNSSI